MYKLNRQKNRLDYINFEMGTYHICLKKRKSQANFLPASLSAKPLLSWSQTENKIMNWKLKWW